MKLPSRIQLLKIAARNPGKTLQAVRGLDTAAVELGRAKTGRGRYGQLAARIGRSEVAKDLTVNTGGFIGSAIGSSVAGPVGGYAGDNLGAVATRKGVNSLYAKHRARKRLGKQASPQQVSARQGQISKALARLDRRKANNLSDQVGWATGNAAAAALGSVPVPLKGGIVASRTVPSIVDGIKAVKSGKLSPKDFLKEVGRDIAKRNDLKGMVRRGNARERLLRSKINKRLRGTFRAYRSKYEIYFARTNKRPILRPLTSNFSTMPVSRLRRHRATSQRLLSKR